MELPELFAVSSLQGIRIVVGREVYDMPDDAQRVFIDQTSCRVLPDDVSSGSIQCIGHFTIYTIVDISQHYCRRMERVYGSYHLRSRCMRTTEAIHKKGGCCY